LVGLAVETGNVEICRTLLEAGADPNAPAQDKAKYTPLMVASVRGYKEVIEALLRAGADTNAEDGPARCGVLFGTHKLHEKNRRGRAPGCFGSALDAKQSN
jgi:ankyrin repeat protein